MRGHYPGQMLLFSSLLDCVSRVAAELLLLLLLSYLFGLESAACGGAK